MTSFFDIWYHERYQSYSFQQLHFLVLDNTPGWMASQAHSEKLGAASFLEVPNIAPKPTSPAAAASPSILVHTLSHPGPSPELDLDRHRQATVELASTHTVILLISTLASLYLAQRVTDSVSGLFFLTLAPAVIIARLLRFRLEYLSRKDFDARFARINDRLKPENGDFIAAPSPVPSEASAYSTSYFPNPSTPSMTAMHAFVPHRLSPIPSIPSSYAAEDGHQTLSSNGYAPRPDYITGYQTPSLSSVSGVPENEDSNRLSYYSLYPDSSVAGEEADPLRRINISPLGSDIDDSNGGLSRRTTASGLSAWVPAHHLATVPSNEEITFAPNPAWNRQLATPRGALNEDLALRDSTYTDTTADFSTRAVENASLRRNGTASTNDTSIRATENGGVSRSTTASGLTGTSHVAVENLHGRFGGQLSEVILPAKKESGDSAQTRNTWHTDMTNGTMGAVENFGGVSRAPTTSSGRTEHTFASDKAVENAGFGRGTNRVPSLGASSVLTHGSNWAVDGHGNTPHSGASSPSKSPLYQPIAMDSPEVHDPAAHAHVWGQPLSVQSPDSILTDRADAGHPTPDEIPQRPVLLGEKVHSDDSLDTIASTAAVEDDSDGMSTQSAHSADPVPQDFAPGGLTDGVLASSVVQGDTNDPVLADSIQADGDFDGDLSSTESDGSAGSAETTGSTGSQLRRRGGIRDKRRRGVKGSRWRAGSEATTHATTMDPAHGAEEREKISNTQGWAQNMRRTREAGQLEIDVI